MFLADPKAEKQYYNELNYLIPAKRNSDHDMYYVDNRGKRIGVLFVFDSKLKYHIYRTKGYPDTNLFIEYKGKYKQLN